eukprot:NODE_6703_length_612_cov_15.875666_g5725_i0.p1 GENE.NODE_6703_length_612_cov_15.875666_g5725_i0~~NODE_6703_length_612_cov_15.875666_g5725_i0.p1  ORF type:complete len:79 (-),score=8.20 NODE_6703_length_612_cov_15.875666_g5725_i0:44-280(-)
MLQEQLEPLLEASSLGRANSAGEGGRATVPGRKRAEGSQTIFARAKMVMASGRLQPGTAARSPSQAPPARPWPGQQGR